MRVRPATALITAAAIYLSSLAAASAPADKQTEPSADSFPLHAVQVIGNNIFSQEEILAATDLKIGDAATPIDFQKALKRLSDSGVFESLEFQYGAQGDGYQVTFQVTELPNFYPVRFEGMDEPAERLHQLLREKVPFYTGQAPPDGPMIKLIGSILEHHRVQQGKDAKVIGRLAPRGESEDEFDLVFQPPSAIKTIAFVTFENTGELSPLDLQRRFNQAAMGVPFSQPHLKELLRHNVRPLYEAKGYLGVVFCPCTAEPDPETEGILVRVHVEQGPVYEFGDIGFAENPSLDTNELAGMILFHRGETADMSLVEKALADIEQRLRASGYMRVFARYDRKVRDQDRQVDVVIEVRPGALYRFGKLTITGLDIEGEAAVKKRWIFARGDPFNGSYPNAFLKRIRGMFDNLSKTDSKVQINEQEKTVDVELIFE